MYRWMCVLPKSNGSTGSSFRFSFMTFTAQKKLKFLSEYLLTRSITLAQRLVCQRLQKSPQCYSNILRQDQSFLRKGNIGHRGDNVWDNTKLRLNFIWKVEGSHIETIIY